MAQFMTSPATDMRLINALENQAAYIEGNPAEDKDLELFYYRFVRYEKDEARLVIDMLMLRSISLDRPQSIRASIGSR
jgi:hypothetical protein